MSAITSRPVVGLVPLPSRACPVGSSTRLTVVPHRRLSPARALPEGLEDEVSAAGASAASLISGTTDSLKSGLTGKLAELNTAVEGAKSGLSAKSQSLVTGSAGEGLKSSLEQSITKAQDTVTGTALKAQETMAGSVFKAEETVTGTALKAKELVASGAVEAVKDVQEAVTPENILKGALAAATTTLHFVGEKFNEDPKTFLTIYLPIFAALWFITPQVLGRTIFKPKPKAERISAPRALDYWMAEPDVVLVDVRLDEQIRMNGMPDVQANFKLGLEKKTALSVPYIAEDEDTGALLEENDDFIARLINTRKVRPDSPVILLTESGDASTEASAILDSGIAGNVFIIEDGIYGPRGWEHYNLPWKAYSKPLIDINKLSRRVSRATAGVTRAIDSSTTAVTGVVGSASEAVRDEVTKDVEQLKSSPIAKPALQVGGVGLIALVLYIEREPIVKGFEISALLGALVAAGWVAAGNKINLMPLLMKIPAVEKFVNKGMVEPKYDDLATSEILDVVDEILDDEGPPSSAPGAATTPGELPTTTTSGATAAAESAAGPSTALPAAEPVLDATAEPVLDASGDGSVAAASSTVQEPAVQAPPPPAPITADAEDEGPVLIIEPETTKEAEKKRDAPKSPN